MSISLVQSCNVHVASTQSATTSTRIPESPKRNKGQDTLSLSEEAIRLSQEHSNVSSSGTEHAKSKPLEHYQLPAWIEEVSTPLLLYSPKNHQEYTPTPAGAIDYGKSAMTALRNALDSNSINSDNNYAEFIMNPKMSIKVKDDVCALLQQDPDAMQLMKTYNSFLYQKLV